MARIERVSVDTHAVDVHRDLSMVVRAYRPGPPQRMDGISIGIVHVTQDAPHAGEVHPDGDELLYVFSGRMYVIGDSAPDEPVELGPGDACIVPRGEWHLVKMIEPGFLLHVTPGPRGDYRPLPEGS